MKMKRTLCLLLSLMMAIGLLAGCQKDETAKHVQTGSSTSPHKLDPVPTPTEELSVDTPEIAAARELGFIPEPWTDLSATADFDGFYDMLKSFVAVADESALLQLEKSIWPDSFPTRDMLRDDALVLLMLAAETVGYDVYNARDLGCCTEYLVNYDSIISELSWDYPYCDAEREMVLYFNDGGEDPVDNVPITAVYWMQRRMDVSQGLHFLDYAGDFDYHLNQPLNREAAVSAVIRLYNSEVFEYNPLASMRVPTDADAALLADAEAVKQAILSNQDVLPCKGTAYYVSTSGSDDNNGLSPETAWASIEKVNTANLSYGDGVYFERGGLWRGQLWAQDGVIYSAYGDGEKPKIYASPENGADPAKWSLLEGTNNIWVYHTDVMDCGNIVFNDGEQWCTKVAPYYMGGYLSTINEGKPFDVKTGLTKDLSFFSKADSLLYDGAPFRYTVMDNCDRNEVPEVVGTLYLRCDAGNPGEVYDSIEFMVRQNIILPADDAVFHNLCLCYTGGHCIYGADMGYDVSFCEIGWVGGSPQYYRYDTGKPIILGNGVECDGSYDHYSVTDCYIYQCYDAGVSNQSPAENSDVTGNTNSGAIDVIQRNICYVRNVFAYNDMHIEIFFTLPDGENGVANRMENVQVADNYFLYAGFGWYYGQLNKGPGWNRYGTAYQGYNDPNASENFNIENNVFYLSSGPLINPGGVKEWLPIFNGNTYVQNRNGVLFTYPSGEYFIPYSNTVNADAYIADILGDKAGVVWTD